MNEDDLESNLFDFLCQKYVQRWGERQKGMRLQYTEAETHDLARTIAKFMMRVRRLPHNDDER